MYKNIKIELCSFIINMCRINITVANIFVLIILQWTCNSNGNRLVTLCEKASVNISCGNGTKINIQDVQFGPLSLAEEIYEGNMTDKQPMFNATNFNRLCNNRSHCYLDETEMSELDTYPYISRLVNITYHCDFEYFGCYEDNEKKLFTGGSFEEYVNANMSALICCRFCSAQDGSRPYFGTEAGYACFCGHEHEINKLNRTQLPHYNWHETKECNHNCRQHEYEKCGRHGLISIYTTKTIHKHYMIIVAEYIKPKCMFNSGFNITKISYLRAKHCERKELENGYNCDENNCWVDAPLEYVIGSLENNLPKYVTINYTCIDQKDEDQVLTAVTKPNKTDILGIMVVSIAAGCLLCGFLIGLFLYKRKCRQTNTSTTADTQQYVDLGAIYSDQKYDDLTVTTQYEDLSVENQYNNMASIDTDHNYDVLNEAR